MHSFGWNLGKCHFAKVQEVFVVNDVHLLPIHVPRLSTHNVENARLTVLIVSTTKTRSYGVRRELRITDEVGRFDIGAL